MLMPVIEALVGTAKAVCADAVVEVLVEHTASPPDRWLAYLWPARRLLAAWAESAAEVLRHLGGTYEKTGLWPAFSNFLILWRAWQDSNLRPLPSEGSTLSN